MKQRWWWGSLALSLLWGSGPISQAAQPVEPFEIVEHGKFIRYRDDRSGQIQVQPNFPYTVLMTPNDQHWSFQWHLPAIRMPEAWDVDQTSPVNGGDPGILVAVLDTGLAYEAFGGFQAAPDIPSSLIWNNPGETADGLDNDGNGYIDDLHGWDFVNLDAHPNDDHGHGTHIAGTIAGATNNTVATAGIAFASQVMPLKVLNTNGNGTTATITLAINYALSKGADVINLSLGGSQPDPLMEQALISAINQGVVVVAAAGNDGASGINYPAKYEPVIAVGATQFDGGRAPYSDMGPELDLVAPGGNTGLDQNLDLQPDGILQQTCSDQSCSAFVSAWYAGTSQASAHVSGVAALLLSCGAAPGSVGTTLRNTAVDRGAAGFDQEYGYGLIDAAAAMGQYSCAAGGPNPPSAITATPSSTTLANLQSHQAYPYAQPTFSWQGTAGSIFRVSWGRVGQAAVVTTQTATTFTPTITAEGAYSLAVRTLDSLGRESAAVSFTYRWRKSVLVIGQTSDRPGIRLYTTLPSLIRSWPGSLGSAQTEVSGGQLERDGTWRIFVTGRDSGRTIKVKTTRGETLRTLEPFGDSFNGSLDAVVLRAAGRREIVVSTRAGGDTLTWLTAGGRVIRKLDLYRSYSGGVRVATGDLDGDGHEEIVTAMQAGHEVRVYRYTAERIAAFSPASKLFTAGWALTTGDQEGDGQQEIVVVNRTGGGQPKVFVTRMRGTLKTSWRLNTLPYRGPLDISTADVDGDGRDELIVLYTRGDRFAVWTLSGQKLREHRILTNGLGATLTTLK